MAAAASERESLRGKHPPDWNPRSGSKRTTNMFAWKHGAYASDSDFHSDLGLDINIGESEASREQKIVMLIKASLYGNIFLFSVKLYASITTQSLAVIGSCLDSFLDLLTQVVIFAVQRCSKLRNREEYPAGLSRLEPIGVILCATVMGIAAVELLWHSVAKLLWSREHQIYFTLLSSAILVLAVIIKMVLYVLCSAYAKDSPSLLTLAEDHRNDVLTNIMALTTGIIAFKYPNLWWFDPLGAILMSVYIATMWCFIAWEQIEMLVGKTAPKELVSKLRRIAERFHPQMKLDIIRVYHFGTRFLVEIEMVLPEDKTVKWAHDRSLKLQKLLEQQANVERAYVHCDWRERDEDEHDWEYIRQKFQDKVRKLKENYYSYQQAYDEEELRCKILAEAKRRSHHGEVDVVIERKSPSGCHLVAPGTRLVKSDADSDAHNRDHKARFRMRMTPPEVQEEDEEADCDDE